MLNKNNYKEEFNTKRQGFTLIELLVVVLIIGILASIAVPMYQRAVMKARVSKALVRMNAIKKRMEIFMLESQAEIPENGGAVILYDPNTVIPGDSWIEYEGGSELINGLTCDHGNMNHICSDDYFSFYGYCLWPNTCLVEASLKSYDRNQGGPRFILQQFYRNGMWENTCDCETKTVPWCKGLQGDWTIINRFPNLGPYIN